MSDALSLDDSTSAAFIAAVARQVRSHPQAGQAHQFPVDMPKFARDEVCRHFEDDGCIVQRTPDGIVVTRHDTV